MPSSGSCCKFLGEVHVVSHNSTISVFLVCVCECVRLLTASDWSKSIKLSNTTNRVVQNLVFADKKIA